VFVRQAPGFLNSVIQEEVLVR
jgi:hypothetical protein